MRKMIILSVTAATMLAFTACGSSENKESANKAAEATKEVTAKTTEVAKETTNKAAEATKEAAAKTVEAAKETATKAVEATKEAAAKVTEKAKEAVEKTAEAAKESATKAVEATKEAAAKVTEKAKETVAAATGGNEKGKAIYAKCVSCHGADGKTKALGKSELIGGWDAAKVEEAINGYKAGTRNVHGMGALMKGQVSALSDEDIKAVAEYISSLK